MPETPVRFFIEQSGSAPARDWLHALRQRSPKAHAKALAALKLLRAHGHELRRPFCEYLRDGIYELRFHLGHVNYRLLYFFYDGVAIVVSHGLTKEAQVPPREIDRASRAKKTVDLHGEQFLDSRMED